MAEVSLQQLLEAGCHFGHKSERWHPHASEFIYTEKDGIHIIDLAKTKIGLENAVKFIRETVAAGGDVLFVATKRQAKGVVKEAVLKSGAPFFVERWIGGFLTNWEEIKKNITKANRMAEEQANGTWKKYPKHEQVKLAQYLKKLNMFYEGVLTIKAVPSALFIIDVKKEIAALREAKRREIPIIGVVDTNSDPRSVDYVIPANDDAVGSIKFIIDTVTEAYAEGMKIRKSQETVASDNDKKGKTEKKISVDTKKTETKAKTEKEPEVITGIDDKKTVVAEVKQSPVDSKTQIKGKKTAEKGKTKPEKEDKSEKKVELKAVKTKSKKTVKKSV
jgi:small subunit ribosomal protein S2